ncbi:MAG TPA: hypothetical protein VD757_01645 [Candidatus Nitrosocosmicus sp.]|nr:hypothetical protein [Candidatus Nitrosocosmicus sp.]
MNNDGSAFDEFVARRCEEGIKNNSEYAKLVDKSIEIHNKLKNILTGEDPELLIEYESTLAAIQSISEETAYKLGLKDGISLI